MEHAYNILYIHIYVSAVFKNTATSQPIIYWANPLHTNAGCERFKAKRFSRPLLKSQRKSLSDLALLKEVDGWLVLYGAMNLMNEYIIHQLVL